jgi:alpha-1,2-mannosyltransferase
VRVGFATFGGWVRCAAGLGAIGLAFVPMALGRPRRPDPVDLVVYRTGGASVLHGWSLYAPSFLAHSGGHLAFTYPPFAAVALVPAALPPLDVVFVLWSVLCLVALFCLVWLSFRRLLDRGAPRNRILLTCLLTAAAVVTVPMSEHLSLGQIGIPLTLLCVADVLPASTRWPRGLLVGVATAMRMTAGLFVVYFVVTRQWRAACTSALTTAVLWLGSALVMPADSRVYFIGRLGFDPQRLGAVLEVANQSLWGTFHRWFGSGGELPWLLLAPIVAVVGLTRAQRASAAGNRLAAAALVGITSELVAPVSWMHHAAWLVPALGAMVGDGRQRPRVAGAVAVWVVLLFLVPHPPGSVGPEPLYSRFVAHEALVYVYLAVLMLLPTGSSRRLRTSNPPMVATST